jgi:hypothetical protein
MTIHYQNWCVWGGGGVVVAKDGAPSKKGKSSGFVAKLLAKQNEVFPDRRFHHVNCITRQEVLRAKTIKRSTL